MLGWAHVMGEEDKGVLFFSITAHRRPGDIVLHKGHVLEHLSAGSLTVLPKHVLLRICVHSISELCQ